MVNTIVSKTIGNYVVRVQIPYPTQINIRPYVGIGIHNGLRNRGESIGVRVSLRALMLYDDTTDVRVAEYLTENENV